MQLKDPLVSKSTHPLPPLENGDRLTRLEFERRYQAMPQIKKAELIEGVVYMGSPLRFQAHAQPHFLMIGWLAAYQAATPGVMGGDNPTVRLDDDNEPQPDIILRIEQGSSTITDDDYLHGAPELVVEIAASSASIDLRDKWRAYRRNGIQEYLVWQVYEQQILWFYLQEGDYQRLLPAQQGILKSQVFPGLWLNEQAMIKGDMGQVLAAVQQGIQTPEHPRFVEQLQTRS
ncbi:MAG: Uma2 family endonuclease [Synechococcaceae cyanobacterium RM1_1_27]|nr:Uma2 family endonuclease [Synechococcaceae cyanobacterium SM2_3_2]NJO86324.1 Uma2 family endonuclease [Synechococcaceae cyanobacterium RM1_1_27]